MTRVFSIRTKPYQTLGLHKLQVFLPTTLADEVLERSQESPDPSVRVIITGSLLDDALLGLDRAKQEGVLAHLQEL